ncbi:MAG: hypothetical protein WCH30_03545 [Chlorobiaceae bacterium]
MLKEPSAPCWWLLWLREIDLFSELYGELFEPLKEKEFFSSFTLEGRTLSWSNGADFAPEFLRVHVACPLQL